MSNADEQSVSHAQWPDEKRQKLLSARQTLDQVVYSRTGEVIGRVLDLRIEPDMGVVAFVILTAEADETNGNLRQFAMPYHNVRYDATRDRLWSPVSPKALARMFAVRGSAGARKEHE